MLPKEYLNTYVKEVIWKLMKKKMRLSRPRFPISNIVKLPSFLIQAFLPTLHAIKKLTLLSDPEVIQVFGDKCKKLKRGSYIKLSGIVYIIHYKVTGLIEITLQKNNSLKIKWRYSLFNEDGRKTY